MTELRETKVKRLQMRSMRRGIKEMDLILSDFASRALSEMDDADLELYDRLLSENDHDIFAWVNGQSIAPNEFQDLTAQIAAGATGLTRPA